MYVDRVTVSYQYFRELNKIYAILLYFKIPTLINSYFLGIAISVELGAWSHSA
jgi:hypothetical protein